jgi:hypothetical protein
MSPEGRFQEMPSYSCSKGSMMFKNLRTASDEMILAEALIYFVFIGSATLIATLASQFIR